MVKFRLRVTAPGGVLEQEYEGPLERVLERLADLAAVVPKEATWEGKTWENDGAPRPGEASGTAKDARAGTPERPKRVGEDLDGAGDRPGTG